MGCCEAAVARFSVCLHDLRRRSQNPAVRQSDKLNAMTINLEFDEQQTQRLQEAARRLNVSVNDLAKAAISDLLAKPESEFDQAANRVLKKNAELYRRLA